MIIIRKFIENDIIENLKRNNPTIKYVDGFTKAKSKAKFQCEICNEFFESQAYDVYTGRIGCPVCYQRNRGIFNLIKRLEENNPSIEYVDGYIEPHKKAKFRCKECGHVWECTAYEVYTGNSHCPNCLKYSALFSEEDIKMRLELNNPDVEYVDGYIGSLDKATFHCKVCDNLWETIAFSVYSGKTGCPKCASSKGEKRVSKYLNNKGIEYEAQYIFDDCKNIYALPFDFYLPQYNICIEYDGEYHFMPIRISKSVTISQAEENFKMVQLRDKIKTDYCKNNNIMLIRIPYTEFDNIEKILDTYINHKIAV